MWLRLKLYCMYVVCSYIVIVYRRGTEYGCVYNTASFRNIYIKINSYKLSFFLKLWLFSAVALPEKLTDLDLTHSIMKTIVE